jgi:ABC-2 type transport system permease protein
MKTQKYVTVFRFSFIQALRNYKMLIGLSIFLITCLVIFAHLWKVVAANSGKIHLLPDELLWYIAFNEWLLVALPDVQDDMEEDLRSGRLAYLLPRPISYLGSIFFEGVGTLSARLIVLGLITFVFTWLRVGNIPFSWAGFLIILAISFVAGCVAIIFKMVVGISAFWVQQVDPFHWIWEKLLFTLGGLMLPLIIYPGWLQKIAYATPFPAILGDRSALAIDFTWDHAFRVTSLLLFWGLIGISFLVLLYRKGLKIVNVEGG